MLEISMNMWFDACSSCICVAVVFLRFTNGLFEPLNHWTHWMHVDVVFIQINWNVYYCEPIRCHDTHSCANIENTNRNPWEKMLIGCSWTSFVCLRFDQFWFTIYFSMHTFCAIVCGFSLSLTYRWRNDNVTQVIFIGWKICGSHCFSLIFFVNLNRLNPRNYSLDGHFQKKNI